MDETSNQENSPQSDPDDNDNTVMRGCVSLILLIFGAMIAFYMYMIGNR